MWSSNFLLAYNLQKLNREKRERQPNWTESEKQLLLCLTKMHQSILENKGSDTMTIKRKSEAWDEIALRMNAAGYNRSKERLKQQLGRIRAAEAKKMKEAIEKNVSGEQLKIFRISNLNNNAFESVKPLDMVENESNQMRTSSGDSLSSSNLPLASQGEGLYIKIEETSATNEVEHRDDEMTTQYSPYDPKCKEMSTKATNSMHFTFQNIQSLANSNAEEIKDQIDENNKKFTNSPIVKNITPNTPTSATAHRTLSNNNEEMLYNANDNDNNSTPVASNDMENQKTSFKKRCRLRRIRLNGIRTLLTSKQRVRQLHLYRIAVERERLRNIKLQQKRDRILYRKDVEIQNLKLQILRNLTNQNRDTNRINF